MDPKEDYFVARPPTADRPLLGITVLVVEDSLFACEAMRLLCLRSGARIRRADSLAHARRHLACYRPNVLIVDMGLPDGSGADLIVGLTRTTPRINVILGTSGDPDAEALAHAAGADGFLPKPVASLGMFQSAILSHLPQFRQPPGPRLLSDEQVTPDRITYHEDLAQVLDVLSGEQDDGSLVYATQFLGGVARSAGDDTLIDAVEHFMARQRSIGVMRPDVARLAAVVQTRLGGAHPF